MSKKVNATISKCVSCGDELVFNPDLNCLFCVSCKSRIEIKSKNNLTKHNLNDNNEIESINNKDWAQQHKSMQCPNCGATSLLLNHDVSTSCAYCNTSLIAKNDQNNILQPDSIIPFGFGKQKAEEMFKENLKNNWFVSKSFKKNISANEINAYYFPAFLFDADCLSNYNGRLYKNEEFKDRNGLKEVRKKYFTINGTQITNHRNIEVEASNYLSQYELNAIRPYNFSLAKQFTNEYVFGYKLEKNSVSIMDSNKTAQRLIKDEIKDSVLKKYSYDGIENFELQTIFSNEKYNYCVLPIYKINYSHKNKNYSNIMNGQTGKLAGDYPKSKAKIMFIILLILMVFLLPILLFIL